MIIPILDQSRKDERSRYGEAVRLSNGFRNHLQVIKKNDLNEIIVNNPAKTNGFDIETAPMIKFKEFLSSNIVKSQSEISFLNRVMAWRNEDDYNKQSLKLNSISKSQLALANSLSDIRIAVASGSNKTPFPTNGFLGESAAGPTAKPGCFVAIAPAFRILFALATKILASANVISLSKFSTREPAALSM